MANHIYNIMRCLPAPQTGIFKFLLQAEAARLMLALQGWWQTDAPFASAARMMLAPQSCRWWFHSKASRCWVEALLILMRKMRVEKAWLEQESKNAELKKMKKKLKYTEGRPEQVYQVFTSQWKQIITISQSDDRNRPDGTIVLHYWSSITKTMYEVLIWSTIIYNLTTPNNIL